MWGGGLGGQPEYILFSSSITALMGLAASGAASGVAGFQNTLGPSTFKSSSESDSMIFLR